MDNLESKSWIKLLDALPRFKGKQKAKDWIARRIGLSGEQRSCVGGFKVDLNVDDIVERSIWLGFTDQDIERLITCLKPGECFIDVGANIGLWSLAAAKKVGKQGRVISFEASPNTAQKLTRHVEINGLQERVQVEPVAVSDHIGTVSFLHNATHAGGSHVCRANDEVGSTTVETTTLDAALDGIAPSLIKIDVEGHEMSVLRGALQVIHDNRPSFIIEYNPRLDPSLTSLRDFEPARFLQDLGYSVFEFSAKESVNRPLDGIWTSKDYTNLLMKP